MTPALMGARTKIRALTSAHVNEPFGISPGRVDFVRGAILVGDQHRVYERSEKLAPVAVTVQREAVAHDSARQIVVTKYRQRVVRILHLQNRAPDGTTRPIIYTLPNERDELLGSG